MHYKRTFTQQIKSNFKTKGTGLWAAFSKNRKI
jgi:hypothetical protein